MIRGHWASRGNATGTIIKEGGVNRVGANEPGGCISSGHMLE